MQNDITGWVFFPLCRWVFLSFDTSGPGCSCCGSTPASRHLRTMLPPPPFPLHRLSSVLCCAFRFGVGVHASIRLQAKAVWRSVDASSPVRSGARSRCLARWVNQRRRSSPGKGCWSCFCAVVLGSMAVAEASGRAPPGNPVPSAQTPPWLRYSAPPPNLFRPFPQSFRS